MNPQSGRAHFWLFIFLVNFNLELNRGDFNFFSSLSLKQFFTVNDTPFPIAIVRKTTPPLFFGRSFRLLLLLPFSPDLSWAILHHPQLNVCKDHSWFYYRGILSPHAHDNLALSKDTLSQIPPQRWARFQVMFQDIWIFPTNFCFIKSDMSGTTVWQQASGFQTLIKMDHFWHF